ncbi:hypothetical protein RFN57_31055 [Streptomyces violaceochromogenes]|uniref:Uncharacterized protein n=1 Tax=Streptomyces violaceochromogenes TaxID=67377 RepID=A0ABU6M556_9ACTN|nr:hypothetical protein [Streptomyces violaceochromogenes]MEC7056697.1 hypothetical protein [Streptomyces violaceochromogenes]GHC65712.1 hypothetical protein GCM10010309_29150 [Streptomyces violaceochromogenes]
MRVGLVGYFDLGHSYGLGDSVFRSDMVAPEPDIGVVGIRNPLGQGTTVSLTDSSPAIVQLWREAAIAQVRRPELDTGWSTQQTVSRAEYDDSLEGLIRQHPIRKCNLTMYAVGVVYLHFELDSGIPVERISGVSACFEYAAYTPTVARALYGAAEWRATLAVVKHRGSLPVLTKRKPTVDITDARGYIECQLFKSMTHLILCVDEGDQAQVSHLMESRDIGSADSITFEYHGRLHYSWPACVIEPRTVPGTFVVGQYTWSPEEEIARMMDCVQIAHVCQGACEAFLSLFLDEIREQVDGYVSEQRRGRNASELNRLRTIALAVANLTNFNLITQAAEDREYFRKFGTDALIAETQQMLRDACETLYSAQEAEVQKELSGRQNILNSIVLLLASFALISTTVDGYDFIRDEEALIAQRVHRVRFLAELVIALASTVIAVILLLNRPWRNKRRY